MKKPLDSSKNSDNLSNMKVKTKVRKHWGDLKPITKIKDSKKTYNRNKFKFIGWGDLD